MTLIIDQRLRLMLIVASDGQHQHIYSEWGGTKYHIFKLGSTIR